MSAQGDVLAVLVRDRAEAAIAAVAELVEAVRDVYGDDCEQVCETSCPTCRIRRALAKFGGAACTLRDARPAPQQPAYAGCTIWRGSLRVSVIETEAIEHCIDADEAFCDLVQRALDSLAAAWDAAVHAAQHQEPTT